ncbi:hypothetical protein VTJ49DRAFT_6961 [Mycothermus thermophilus]|uniref:Uncharacterized protein n=1 Tax=Humicola insolens TaxID=85995 RepID=A0ABR3VIY0_HUMIN
MQPAPPLPPPPPPVSLPNAPPPSTSTTHQPSHTPQSILTPNIPPTGPPNTVLLSLLIYNGYPFCDHWEYFVSAPASAPEPSIAPSVDASHASDIGTVLQAKGNVREGFVLEVKRGWDISQPGQRPDRVVRLGWVDRGLLEPVGEVLFGEGLGCSDERVKTGSDGGRTPVIEENCEARCGFEKIVFRVPAPGKTLRDAEVDGVERRARITQRNCQTWIIETAVLLAGEGVLEHGIVEYLKATKQV